VAAAVEVRSLRERVVVAAALMKTLLTPAK
jgi:hypothetical protein